MEKARHPKLYGQLIKICLRAELSFTIPIHELGNKHRIPDVLPFVLREVLGANFVVRFIAFRNILMIKQAIKVHVRVTRGRGCRLVLRENKRNSLNQWILLKEAASLAGCVQISTFPTCVRAPRAVAVLPNLGFANSALFTASLRRLIYRKLLSVHEGRSGILSVIKKSESAADVCMLGMEWRNFIADERTTPYTPHFALNFFIFNHN